MGRRRATLDPMATVPAPLLSFLLYHRSMRGGAQRLADALAAESSGPRREALVPWFRHFREACLVHAEGEDKVLWPALADTRPEMAPLFDAMDAQHDELDRTLADLAAVMDDAARHPDAAAVAGRLVDVLARHLDDEERNAVPLLIGAFPNDLGDLMRRAHRQAGPEGAAIALPFLLEYATAEERATVLAALPEPVRQRFESEWSDAYERLCGAFA